MVALLNMPVLSSVASKTVISQKELDQRVAVIKRFKELLKAQRDRFRTYLDALDRQKDVIEKGSADDLMHHVELEEKIVEDIFSIQKVIDPLEEMYHTVSQDFSKESGLKSGEKNSGGREEVTGLKEALEGLKAEAAIRSEQNRLLLAKRMAELRSEIKSLRSNAYARRRYENTAVPTQIDIQG